MQNGKNEKQRGLIASFIGEPTPAKVSGLTYTLASVAVVVLSFLFLMILGISGLAAEEGYEKSDWYIYCSYLISPVAFALVALAVLRWSHTPLKAEIKAQKCRPKYFLVALTLQIGLLCLSELNTLFLDFLARFGYEDTPISLPSMDGLGFVGVLLAVAVLPAIFEEVIFRGLLLKGMRSFGTVGMILISGGLFALYHQNPAQTLYQFCCGAAFALVAIRSGSILPTAVAHFINNALILTLTKFGISEFSAPVFVTVIAVSVLCLVGSLVWLIFFDKNQPEEATDKEERKKERKRFWLSSAVGIALCALTWLSVLLTGM